MDKSQVNPLDREVAELNEKIGEAQKRLELLARNRQVVEQVMQACSVSTVCTVCGELSLWIRQDDLTKARCILGKFKLSGKQAAGATRLCVFLKTEHPEIGLAYYRAAPDPAHSRCKIVTEEKTETHKHYSLVCPS